MKILKAAIILLIICVLGLSTWNTIQLKKQKKIIELQRAEISRQSDSFNKIKNAVIGSQKVSMNFLGKKILWQNIERIFPGKEDKSFQEFPSNPKLVLLFSEFSCNVCQDNETKFAVDIAAKMGRNFVIAVVQSNEKRYVSNYVRLNQVNFPVYICSDDTFFLLNDFHDTPMVFLIDEENRIIASHFPIPGQPEYSEPIHRFCIDYLNRF